MARPHAKLSAVEIAKQTKPGLYSDGGGLYLRVGPTGSKSWVFRFMVDRKSHDMGLGPVHTISLKQARELARTAREARLGGENPIETRLLARQKKKTERAITFQHCAEQFVAGQKAGWKDRYTDNWEATLIKPGHIAQVHEVLGPLSIRDIDRETILTLLTRELPNGRTLWQEHPRMMSELRRRVESVLGWAKAAGYRSGDNPAGWKENLEHALAAASKIRETQHHPALSSYTDIGRVFSLFGNSPSIASPVIQFVILVACRVDAVARAMKHEFDLDTENIWTIPGARLKGLRKELRVPLSTPAIALIRRQMSLSSSEFVFPGRNPSKPIGSTIVSKTVHDIGWHEHLTTHGFRATFTTWAYDAKESFRPDIIEMALAHKVGNETYEAYQRGDLLNRRRVLMDAWASFVIGPAFLA